MDLPDEHSSEVRTVMLEMPSHNQNPQPAAATCRHHDAYNRNEDYSDEAKHAGI